MALSEEQAIDLQARLRIIEERLNNLKSPSAGGGASPTTNGDTKAVPLLINDSLDAERPHASRYAALGDPKQIDAITGDATDFDMCFKFSSMSFIQFLEEEVAEKEITPELKKIRETKLKAEKAELVKESFWFKHVTGDRGNTIKAEGNQARPIPRFPSESPGVQEIHHRHHPGEDHDYDFEADCNPDAISGLIDSFIMEDRDRKVLQLMGMATNITQTRFYVLSLLVSFFRRDESSRYSTYLFTSVDRDEIFLCVRMSEDAAARHAEQSGAYVELDKANGATKLDVEIPDEPDPRAYCAYTQYLDKAGLIRHHATENGIGTKVPFGKAQRITLLYDRVTDVLDIVAMKQWKLMIEFYPLHTMGSLKRLKIEIGSSFAPRMWVFNPPLDHIHSYFGSEVALYFMFVSLLCKYLCLLSLVAVILAAYVAFQDGSIQVAWDTFLFGSSHSDVRALYALIIIIWSVVLELDVKRCSRRLLVEWGESIGVNETSIKPIESERFHSTLMTSDVDSRLITMDVTTKEKIRGRHIARLSTALFALVVIAVMSSLYLGAAWMDNMGHPAGVAAAGYIITVMIKVFKRVWASISSHLIDKEFHRYEVDFLASWSRMTVLIQLITSFAPFFYIGFVMPHVDDCPSAYDNFFSFLCHQMIIIFISTIIFSVWDIIYPAAMLSWKTWAEKRDAEKLGEEIGTLSFLEMQSKMQVYGSEAVAQDFCDIVIPLAYVVLFGITLPFCPVLALLALLIQIHADAFKLTTSMRRPHAVASKGLGVWEDCITNFGSLAIYTNSGLVCTLMMPLKEWHWHWQLLAFFSCVTIAQLVRQVLIFVMPVEDAQATMAIKRQERWDTVVKKVQTHYDKSCLEQKDAATVEALSRRDVQSVLRDAEEGEQPCVLQASSDLDLSKVTPLTDKEDSCGRCSKYYIKSSELTSASHDDDEMEFGSQATHSLKSSGFS